MKLFVSEKKTVFTLFPGKGKMLFFAAAHARQSHPSLFFLEDPLNFLMMILFLERRRAPLSCRPFSPCGYCSYLLLLPFLGGLFFSRLK